jgi:SAM-dependent methyltransferase
VTLRRSDAAARFSTSAAAYAATMAPALRPVAERVVRQAGLRAGERVLDAGTGTGTAAGLARGDGRVVTGLDGAAGMLEIARAEVPGVTFVDSDFGAMPFADASFDAVIACHALLFAADRVAVLHEWRRVTRPGGRLSLSVPGPWEATVGPLYDPIYASYGLTTARDYPDLAELVEWAGSAGWDRAEGAADAGVAIQLADEAAYRLWLTTGSRGSATAGWPAERFAALKADLLAATPGQPDGSLRVPFGALYMVASAPA